MLDLPMADCRECGRSSYLAAVGQVCLACFMGWDAGAAPPGEATATEGVKS